MKDYLENYLANSNVTNQAISPNLATKATALAIPRTINGVPFDGTADISIPLDASVLSGIIPLEKGGTGAITASAVRTNFGLWIGVDVQAPLVANVDFQRPLVAGIDYQIPLVAGIPTAPTALTSDNSQQIATTAFVQALAANAGSGSVSRVLSLNVNASGNVFSSSVANATSTPQLSLTIPRSHLWQERRLVY